MDLRDFSEDPRFVRALKETKAAIRRARSMRTEPAISEKSISERISRFLQRKGSESAKETEKVQLSFLPPKYRPSTYPLARLFNILVRDLFVEEKHPVQYVILRTVTTMLLTSAVTLEVLAEDETGDVIVVQINNPGPELMKVLDLPDSCVLLVIKEPFVTVMDDGNFAIRVDHVSDLIVMSDTDHRIPEKWRSMIAAEEGMSESAIWRSKGDRWLQMDYYQLAIQCYTKALESEQDPHQVEEIMINISICRFKVNSFEGALLEVDKILARNNESEVALLSKVHILRNLDQFPGAKRTQSELERTHRELAHYHPTNQLAKQVLRDSRDRLNESREGEYDFKSMISRAKNIDHPQLDHATYRDPVCVRMTTSRGRGLFTSRAVKAGELLLCEKAFSYAYFRDTESLNSMGWVKSFETNTIIGAAHGGLIEFIVHKLAQNPSLMNDFVNLFGGFHDDSVSAICQFDSSDTTSTQSNAFGTCCECSASATFPRKVDGQVIIDTFLVQKIIDLNCIGCPLLSSKSHEKAPNTDPLARESPKFYYAGLWQTASYINHSCLANTRRSFIGDMMIVRATQDLEEGTELTFWYKSPLENLAGKAMAMPEFGFTCSCEICAENEALPAIVRSNRKRYSINVGKLFNAKKVRHDTIENALKKLNETYSRPPYEVPRLEVFPGCVALATAFWGSGKVSKAVQYALMGLDALGFVIEGGSPPYDSEQGSELKLRVEKWGLMVDGVVQCWVTLAQAYRKLAPSLEAQAEGYAKLSYEICVGERETFADTY